MAFQFKIVKRAIKVDLPSFPSLSAETAPERLTGTVQDKDASAPEERMAKALDKQGIQYIFRYVVGAPKGMPGWKELDFLISSDGMLNAVEVDTVFTHRNKQQSDLLHDAIILNDQGIRTMGDIYPVVRHASGDTELSSQDLADKYVKQNFHRGPSTVGRANEYETPEVPEGIAPAVEVPSNPAIQTPQVSKNEPKKIVNKQVITAKKKVVVTRPVERKIARYDK
jgi:hypothetical protein